MAPARLTEEERRARTETAYKRGGERVTGGAQPQAADDDRGPSLRLATLPRGDGRAELRISWDEFKGHKFVNLRQWNRADDGSWRPDTKRGLSIKRRERAAVVDALTKAVALAAESDR